MSSIATQQKMEEKLKKNKKKKIDKRLKQVDNMEVEIVPIASLTPNEWNPNRQDQHEFGLLVKSIQEDGFTQPVLISEDSIIVDGEHRWRAMLSLGYDSIPVVRAPMTAEQMRIATIRHNKARGSHDIEHEAALLQSLVSAGFGDWVKESLQLSDVEMRHFINDIKVDAPIEAPKGASASEVSEIVNRIRAEEEATAKALADQQTSMATNARARYRLSLVFGAAEAKVVKAVLGKERAPKVLELCEKYGAE